VTRRNRDDDGRTEDGRPWFEAPQLAGPALVERIEPTPFGVPTPQLGDDPTAWIAAMRQALRGGREAAEARAGSRVSAAPRRRSLRRVFA
jgi:hypothetical protein